MKINELNEIMEGKRILDYLADLKRNDDFHNKIISLKDRKGLFDFKLSRYNVKVLIYKLFKEYGSLEIDKYRTFSFNNENESSRNELNEEMLFKLNFIIDVLSNEYSNKYITDQLSFDEDSIIELMKKIRDDRDINIEYDESNINIKNITLNDDLVKVVSELDGKEYDHSNTNTKNIIDIFSEINIHSKFINYEKFVYVLNSLDSLYTRINEFNEAYKVDQLSERNLTFEKELEGNKQHIVDNLIDIEKEKLEKLTEEQISETIILQQIGHKGKMFDYENIEEATVDESNVLVFCSDKFNDETWFAAPTNALEDLEHIYTYSGYGDVTSIDTTSYFYKTKNLPIIVDNHVTLKFERDLFLKYLMTDFYDAYSKIEHYKSFNEENKDLLDELLTEDQNELISEDEVINSNGVNKLLEDAVKLKEIMDLEENLEESYEAEVPLEPIYYKEHSLFNEIYYKLENEDTLYKTLEEITEAVSQKYPNHKLTKSN